MRLTDADEIKLKPCPFCGGEPYFYTKATGEENGALKFYFRIACRRCQTSPNKAYGEIKIYLLDNGELSISHDDRKKLRQNGTGGRMMDDLISRQTDTAFGFAKGALIT